MKPTLLALALALLPLALPAQTALPESVLKADAKVVQLNLNCSALSKEHKRLQDKRLFETRNGLGHNVSDAVAENRAWVDLCRYERELSVAYQWDYRIRDALHLPALPKPTYYVAPRR